MLTTGPKQETNRVLQFISLHRSVFPPAFSPSSSSLLLLSRRASSFFPPKRILVRMREMLIGDTEAGGAWAHKQKPHI
ncbi:Hypothetical protein SMAX5B_007720 [Scophthalmus maximus]|uniref:Uncharacterized protein n=1 Tax=Scophthalmus maximus TaxID=52904 RepID=A0A2U9B299_SCOMX|nr:Hypothetical protein SMAX5B_007720 [Scophthalmus maximus]